MHICIDSNVFIRGLATDDPTIKKILSMVGEELTLSIPRLVTNEVSRNLRATYQLTLFYRLFHKLDTAIIIDEPVPTELVAKYVALGLRAKADAFIGAFAEWQQVDYLLSDNRHFLRELPRTTFRILTPDEFVVGWHSDTL